MNLLSIFMGIASQRKEVCMLEPVSNLDVSLSSERVHGEFKSEFKSERKSFVYLEESFEGDMTDFLEEKILLGGVGV